MESLSAGIILIMILLPNTYAWESLGLGTDDSIFEVELLPGLNFKPKYYTYQDPRHKRLSSIPQNIPFDVHYIFLKYNNISNIPANAFSKFKNLVDLKLEKSGIKYMRKDAFNGLYKLHQLSLSKNLISEIPQGLFCNLENLHYLKVDHNYIKHMMLECLENLKQQSHTTHLL